MSAITPFRSTVCQKLIRKREHSRYKGVSRDYQGSNGKEPKKVVEEEPILSGYNCPADNAYFTPRLLSRNGYLAADLLALKHELYLPLMSLARPTQALVAFFYVTCLFS